MTKQSSASPPNQISANLVAAHVISIGTIVMIVKEALGFADVTEALAFYGVYHREPGNQLIHFFGVPGILYSSIIFLVHLKVPFFGDSQTIQQFLPEKYQLTYGLILAVFYAVFYLQIDPIGGALYAPLLFAMYSSAVHFFQQDQKEAGGKSWSGTGNLLKYAFALHVFSWYIQIHLGHKILEGAQPAVLESIGGALTVAPLFSFYEFLWLLGVNKELQMETLRLVEQHTLDICSAGNSAMRVCETLAS